MVNKKRELPIDPRLKIENFYKRWSIDISDEERWVNFKNRVLNSYASTVGPEILCNAKCEREFFKIIGVHLKTDKGIHEIDIPFNRKLIDSPTYKFLLEEKDFKKFILGLEVIFQMESIESDYKYNFQEDINDAIVTSLVPIVLKEVGEDILFYPSGAKLLDEKLVNDNLDWLVDYPQSYSTFKNALVEYGIKGKERQVIDNMRLSLELLLKEILKNNKSIENQKNEVGKYLKERKVSTEISNLFWTVSDYYSKYQNDKVKHSDNIPENEVEFLIYLTGSLIRFLLIK